MNYEIIGDGVGVHWPDVDEDISAQGMLTGVPARPPKAVGDAIHIANGTIIKKLAKEANYDVHQLIENMRKREKESKAKVVSRTGKKTTVQ